jgi:hypothetical protein
MKSKLSKNCSQRYISTIYEKNESVMRCIAVRFKQQLNMRSRIRSVPKSKAPSRTVMKRLKK